MLERTITKDSHTYRTLIGFSYIYSIGRILYIPIEKVSHYLYIYIYIYGYGHILWIGENLESDTVYAGIYFTVDPLFIQFIFVQYVFVQPIFVQSTFVHDLYSSNLFSSNFSPFPFLFKNSKARFRPIFGVFPT